MDKQALELLRDALPGGGEGVRWFLVEEGGASYLVPRLDPEAVKDLLDETVGPGGWSEEYRALERNREAWASCRLTVAGVTREAPGVGLDYRQAFGEAFVEAAARFGVGRPLSRLPRYRVKGRPPKGFVPKAPARFAEDLARLRSGQELPEEVEIEPQAEAANDRLEQAQRYINEMVARARELGLGAEAARIVARHPTALKDLNQARKLYAELKALVEQKEKAA